LHPLIAASDGWTAAAVARSTSARVGAFLGRAAITDPLGAQ
jgi:hypothetical protein